MRVRVSGTRGTLPADGVALHAAWVRSRLEEAVGLARDRRHAAERPGRMQRDVVASPLEVGDGPRGEPRLEGERLPDEAPRMERRDEMVGVELRRVDRRLQVEAAVDVAQERMQRPLLLLIPARG